MHHPIITSDENRIAGLRLGDPRAHALLQALLVFGLIPNGFFNRDLRGLLAGLLGKHPHEIIAGQVSYDLRRLRAHGLITRIPKTHRYRITDTGLHHAMLITHIHTRLLQPGLAQLTDPDPPAPCAPPHATTSAPSTSSPKRPDSPHNTKPDSIKPTSSDLACLVTAALIRRGIWSSLCHRWLRSHRGRVGGLAR